MLKNLTIDYAENPGVNPEILQEDEQYAKRQLEAGERMLTRVIREKNYLQDAHTRLGVELGNVRAQLADSVKENKRLRRGILVSARTNLYTIQRRSGLTELCL